MDLLSSSLESTGCLLYYTKELICLLLPPGKQIISIASRQGYVMLFSPVCYGGF
jgi:hypothetical protein